MIHQRHRRTHGQTDRRTDDLRSQDRTLHCSASRDKNVHILCGCLTVFIPNHNSKPKPMTSVTFNKGGRSMSTKEEWILQGSWTDWPIRCMVKLCYLFQVCDTTASSFRQTSADIFHFHNAVSSLYTCTLCLDNSTQLNSTGNGRRCKTPLISLRQCVV